MPQYGSSHNIVFSLIDVKCYIIPIWFSLFTCFILIFLWMLMKNFFDISPALGTLLFASYLLRFILCFSHYPICNCKSCSGRTVCDASQIPLFSEFAPVHFAVVSSLLTVNSYMRQMLICFFAHWKHVLPLANDYYLIPTVISCGGLIELVTYFDFPTL